MSRLGKLPISIPSGVDVKIQKESIHFAGPRGKVDVPLHPSIKVNQEDGQLTVETADDSRMAREQHGLRRALYFNAVTGVSTGFTKELEVVGVVLNVGFSHPVNFKLPQGVEAKVDGNKITLGSHDKQLLGEVAARIRRVRPPEPYKGKGIKYKDEVIRRKAGKSGKSAK
jgi:large subunit ribosomal protein L6